ncbi:hypothetical protein L1049_007388 [Liquidambar formosana]|uniref:Protein kinase domain-containing protein n=1 Tax=Liquidambar formosana TaxID=63359 RepID=A0AAP0N5N7_LIQFO
MVTAQMNVEDHQSKRRLLVIILLPIAVVIFILGSLLCYLQMRVLKTKATENESLSKLGGNIEAAENFDNNTPNLRVFSFANLVAITNNFSMENKLGEGGYGPVYKGELPNGQEIAVKRLSKMSKQGLEEFKNEVMLTAKLQHVNLVRLLGFCNQREEKMLIYEYMPNKSLDFYLFAQKDVEDNQNKKRLLMIILLPIAMVIFVLGFMLCYLRRRVLKSKVATNNFSIENKLGEGGYGPVYKGELLNGQEIAVKRLSKTSKQGLEEYKNEVMLTAKLQHVNLVRLLGFCTQREEKMLIYEYMQNKSLDFYLFVTLPFGPMAFIYANNFGYYYSLGGTLACQHFRAHHITVQRALHAILSITIIMIV